MKITEEQVVALNIMRVSCGSVEKALEFVRNGEHKEYRLYNSFKQYSTPQMEKLVRKEYEIVTGS